MSRHYTRRDRSDWHKLVEQQLSSNLSGAQFCRQHHIGYASFMAWRKRLQLPDAEVKPVQSNAFVELTAPARMSEWVQAEPATDSAINVTLSLGDGIELRIVRS